jgi:hypothetical protein
VADAERAHDSVERTSVEGHRIDARLAASSIVMPGSTLAAVKSGSIDVIGHGAPEAPVHDSGLSHDRLAFEARAA